MPTKPARVPVAKTFRVEYDRPRGLSPEGYHALVHDEYDPPKHHTLAHIQAMCRKWNVTARLYEWNTHAFYHGQVDADGKLKKPSEHHDKSRAHYEKRQAERYAVDLKHHKKEAADVREREREMRKLRAK
jgi:hypothetical protein